ncbi:MAG TPA: hypothetical protein VFS40_11695 [Gemmatimonadales bacterium]|nr:hypothetical protein [Gemmatimonadales bacterium]
MLVRGLLVFVCAVALDALWALYIRRSAQGQAVQAATYATVLLALGAFNTLSFLDDNLMLVPAGAGAWLGTFLTVRREHRQEHAGGTDRERAEAVARLLRETAEHPTPIG